jgi:hypothetical protein
MPPKIGSRIQSFSVRAAELFGEATPRARIERLYHRFLLSPQEAALELLELKALWKYEGLSDLVAALEMTVGELTDTPRIGISVRQPPLDNGIASVPQSTRATGKDIPSQSPQFLPSPSSASSRQRAGISTSAASH